MNRDDLFEAHRQRLIGLAYRMVGAMAEAEDLVQETWLRWHANESEVREPGPWLTRVLTRLCLDHLRSARRRREQYVGPWLPEPVATDSGAMGSLEMADALSHAMLFLLERLTPPERASFLLREVFDYSYGDIAAMVDASEAACRKMVSRARGHLQGSKTRFDADPEHRNRLIAGFAEATRNGDMNNFMGLLSQDCILYADGGGKVIAARKPLVGSEKVARFLIGIRKSSPDRGEINLVTLNGETGILITVDNQPISAFTFALNEEQRIHEIYVMRNPDKLMHLQAVV